MVRASSFSEKMFFALHRHGAGGGAVQAAQHVQQGAFAAAGGADDGDELALLHRQVHAVQGFDQRVAAAVVFFQVMGLQDCHGAGSFPNSAKGPAGCAEKGPRR